MTNPSLRVGRIPYANLVPIFHALTTHFSLEDVRFVNGTPSELNRKLRAGRLDVSPSSSIEYGKHPDRYLLCPDISISSRSKVMSVLLLSNEPLGKLPDGPIAVTESSDTSVVLLEILLRESLGKRNRLVRTALPPGEALRRHPAYLAIGDEALQASLSGTARHVTDLGEWWRRETGTPFVFALWIISREALPGRRKALRGFARTLLTAKRIARESLTRPEHLLIGPNWMPKELRTAYWRNLSYDLEEEEEGLLLFYRLAKKIGRIPKAPPLRFLDLR
ncbi:MAG TPA: menaquinone biosynthesis protein [Candidatus Limnocylindrales bacterium]|nr:menaquinone biosynthesis protein [Candidatus Limnocylindrales bacterium]